MIYNKKMLKVIMILFMGTGLFLSSCARLPLFSSGKSDIRLPASSQGSPGASEEDREFGAVEDAPSGVY